MSIKKITITTHDGVEHDINTNQQGFILADKLWEFNKNYSFADSVQTIVAFLEVMITNVRNEKNVTSQTAFQMVEEQIENLKAIMAPKLFMKDFADRYTKQILFQEVFDKIAVKKGTHKELADKVKKIVDEAVQKIKDIKDESKLN